MKKLLLILSVVVLSIAQLSAQESTFEKGDKVLNLGIGFGNGYFGSYYTSSTPAISASFETGVADNILDKGSIGLGGYVGFSSAKYSSYWKTTNFVIGARGAFHYPFVSRLDTYTGLQLGFNIYKTKYYDNPYVGGFSANSNSFGFAWFAGARYYFTDAFAVMGEVGVGVAYLTLGVALKL